MAWFDSPAREKALLDEARRAERQRVAMRSQVTPAVARNTAQIAGSYPTLDREVITAASLAGVPAISVPAGFSEKLPVGLQLIAPQFAESKLLAAAHAFQNSTDHHLQKPSFN